MSREIKFRAWNNEKYIYAPNRFVYTDDYDKDDVDNYKDIGEFFCTKDNIEQYTGLKDKNGKEIYEGDIVKAKIQGFWETGPNTICEGKATWNLEVVYNEIRYMDVFHILGSKNAPDTIYYLFEDKLSDIEVIGNIHENPELLEN